jgi:hypothetical protein
MIGYRLHRSQALHRVAGILVAALWILHFDFWNWSAIHPIYLGIFPAGLFYHLLFSLVALLVMPFFFCVVWPPDPPELTGGRNREGTQ